MRFYKSLANTGPHVGTLWAADVTALGSVTFKNETPSWWQTATFDRPIPIEANAIYVASYHTRTGHYAFATEYFTSADTGASPGPLTAPPSADDAHGVYRYGPEPAFPDSSHRASNYWVDVVFVPADMTAPAGAATDVSRIQFLDALAADFARAAFDRTAIAETSDGEVMLAPHGGSEFSGETSPRDWRTVGWDADGVPAGSRLEVGVRTGNTAERDAAWSGFLPASESGAPLRATSRYLQYRLQLSTGAPDATPVVRDVAITGISRPD